MTEAALARIIPRPTPTAPARIPASRCVLGYINRLANVFIRWGAADLKTRTLNYALTDRARADVLFVLRDSNEHQDLADIMGLRGRPDENWLADILTELWKADRVEFSAVKIGIGTPSDEWMKKMFLVMEKRGGAGPEILEDILGSNWRWELRHF